MRRDYGYVGILESRYVPVEGLQNTWWAKVDCDREPLRLQGYCIGSALLQTKNGGPLNSFSPAKSYVFYTINGTRSSYGVAFGNNRVVLYCVMIFGLGQQACLAENRSILIASCVLIYMILFGHGLPTKLSKQF